MITHKMGTSLDEAGRIASFLHEHIAAIGIVRFGDSEDAALEVKQSARIYRIEREQFAAVMQDLREKLATGDLDAINEAMKVVEWNAAHLFSRSCEADARSQAILDKFG